MTTHTGSGPDPTAHELREVLDLKARAERELTEAAEIRRAALAEADKIVVQAQQLAAGVAEEAKAAAKRDAAEATAQAGSALQDLVSIASALRDTMAAASIRLDDILDQLGEVTEPSGPAGSSRFRR
jgi:cell division septum initiation protein DivIVA